MQTNNSVGMFTSLQVLYAALIVCGAPMSLSCTMQKPALDSANSSERQSQPKQVITTVGQVRSVSQTVEKATASDKHDPAPRPKVDTEAVSEFNRRVSEYVKLHKSLEKTPGLPAEAEPEILAAHQKQLAEAIQTARKEARPGDIFGAAEPYFRRMITANLRKDVEAKETVLTDGNPKAETPAEPIKLAANAVYPEKAPVSTVPPILLLRLPPLPDELNYRFVGRHLILLDIHASLIVDYLLNVVP